MNITVEVTDLDETHFVPAKRADYSCFECYCHLDGTLDEDGGCTCEAYCDDYRCDVCRDNNANRDFEEYDPED